MFQCYYITSGFLTVSLNSMPWGISITKKLEVQRQKYVSNIFIRKATISGNAATGQCMGMMQKCLTSCIFKNQVFHSLFYSGFSSSKISINWKQHMWHVFCLFFINCKILRGMSLEGFHLRIFPNNKNFLKDKQTCFQFELYKEGKNERSCHFMWESLVLSTTYFPFFSWACQSVALTCPPWSWWDRITCFG